MKLRQDFKPPEDRAELLFNLLEANNPNEIKIISYCDIKPRSVGELTRLIGIAQNNLLNRVKAVEETGWIIVERGEKGKRTLIKTHQEDEFKYHSFYGLAHFLTIFYLSEEIVEKKGCKSFDEDTLNLFFNSFIDKKIAKLSREKFKQIITGVARNLGLEI